MMSHRSSITEIRYNGELFAYRVPSVTVVSDMSDAMRFLTILIVLASITALCSAFLLPKSREDEDKGGEISNGLINVNCLTCLREGWVHVQWTSEQLNKFKHVCGACARRVGTLYRDCLWKQIDWKHYLAGHRNLYTCYLNYIFYGFPGINSLSDVIMGSFKGLY